MKMNTTSREETLTSMQSVAGRIAHSFARSYPTLGRDEIQQEAMAVLIEGQRRKRYNPELGPYEPYAFSTCARWLHGFARIATNPTTGSTHSIDVMEWYRAVPIAAEQPLNGAVRDDADFDGVVLRDETTPEDLVIDADWHERVRDTLVDVVADLSYPESVMRVLLQERSAIEEAAICGLPTSKLYELTRQAKERLAACSALWQLWNER